MNLSIKKINFQALRINMDAQTHTLAKVCGVDESEWLAWERGESSPNITHLGKIGLYLIRTGKIFSHSYSSADLQHSLTRIQHLNDKLSESALGADVTLHEMINEEIEKLNKKI